MSSNSPFFSEQPRSPQTKNSKPSNHQLLSAHIQAEQREHTHHSSAQRNISQPVHLQNGQVNDAPTSQRQWHGASRQRTATLHGDEWRRQCSQQQPPQPQPPTFSDHDQWR